MVLHPHSGSFWRCPHRHAQRCSLLIPWALLNPNKLSIKNNILDFFLKKLKFLRKVLDITSQEQKNQPQVRHRLGFLLRACQLVERCVQTTWTRTETTTGQTLLQATDACLQAFNACPSTSMCSSLNCEIIKGLPRGFCQSELVSSLYIMLCRSPVI